MTGNSVVTTTTNAGVIEYAAPVAGIYKTLTTNDYVGQSGAIKLNTWLGNDSSPSDKLVINGGAASGTTTLDIANTGGPDALTTDKGILVVETINGGSTAVGAFVLSSPVTAGGYSYALYRNTNGNWYLSNNPKDWRGSGGGATAVPALNPAALALLAVALALMVFRQRRW
jgi:outer membrane autotransporter protein